MIHGASIGYYYFYVEVCARQRTCLVGLNLFYKAYKKRLLDRNVKIINGPIIIIEIFTISTCKGWLKKGPCFLHWH